MNLQDVVGELGRLFDTPLSCDFVATEHSVRVALDGAESVEGWLDIFGLGAVDSSLVRSAAPLLAVTATDDDYQWSLRAKYCAPPRICTRHMMDNPSSHHILPLLGDHLKVFGQVEQVPDLGGLTQPGACVDAVVRVRDAYLEAHAQGVVGYAHAAAPPTLELRGGVWLLQSNALVRAVDGGSLDPQDGRELLEEYRRHFG